MRRDPRRATDDHADAVEQLLGLTEAGHDVAAQDQIRVDVPDEEHRSGADVGGGHGRILARRTALLSRSEQKSCPVLLVSRTACHARRVTTVCFVGAGSAEFTRQLLRDLLTYDDLGPLTLVMHDIDPRRLELAEGLARIAVERHGRPATIRSSLDRAAAVAGADFVINAVNIGGHAATLTDFEVPARFGLRQTIADTLGVGGIFRGLRTFGFLDGLARDMLDGCPDAWLLNYTNPMAMNIQFLHHQHPRLKVLGLCHSVYWTVHDLCALIGVDLRRASASTAPGSTTRPGCCAGSATARISIRRSTGAIAADPQLRRRVRVDMYRRLGYYPTETSEHSAEYVPWYLHDAQRDRAAADPGRRLRADLRCQPGRDRGADPGGGGRSVRRARGGGSGVRAAGHPQHGHRHRTHDPGERRRTRPDR